jgi:hypothetical protein
MLERMRASHVHGSLSACRRTLEALDGMASASGRRFSMLDKLYMAAAWGYGHAATHAVFFFLSMLSLTVSEGTYYRDSCPQMSIFLVRRHAELPMLAAPCIPLSRPARPPLSACTVPCHGKGTATRCLVCLHEGNTLAHDLCGPNGC